MKYDLSLFEAEVERGNLRRVEDEDLILYNYTEKCVFDKAWNEITRISRGIIFDKSSGELVAKPFPKFFNLGEIEETMIKNFPNEPYQVTEKYDGSLGIIFNHKGKWRVATRGSLNSVQAQRATELLQKYDMSVIPYGITILVEIIYPENKIVVNYGDEEKLVLIGGYDITTGFELFRNYGYFSLQTISNITNLEIAQSYDYGIDEMIKLQKTLPKDKEGFVVHFFGGLRVKIKGDEYMKISRMLSTMSPLSFWESMENGIVKKEYLQQLPEEFRKDFEPIVKLLEDQYTQVLCEINIDAKSVAYIDMTTKEGKKELGLLLQKPDAFLHPNAMFSFFGHDNGKSLNKYVMKKIRPTGNVLVQL